MPVLGARISRDENFSHKPMLLRPLSGEVKELRTIQLYTRREGELDVELRVTFTGRDNIGHSAAIALPFDIQPATRVKLEIRDEKGSPAFAAITVTDGVNRLLAQPASNPLPQDYRQRYAMRRPWKRGWILKRTSKPSGPGAATSAMVGHT